MVESGTATANGSARAAQTIEVLNPANGEVVGTIDAASPQEVEDVVARVRANQAEWEALGIDGRARWLGRLRDWILDNFEEISDTVQAETGKVRGDISPELFYVTDLVNFYGKHAAK